MEPARLRLEPSRIEGQLLTLGATLEHPELGRQRLWWQLPAAWAKAVTPWADPFVVGFVFSMMQWGHDVVVEGRVSPSLLANLEAFMAYWHVWRPAAYRPVSIRGQEEIEPPPPAGPGQTILPFSCGLDSSFTLFRHRRGMMGRRNCDIRAAVVMNGFDIWLNEENGPAIYAGLLESARVMLDSQAVACIPMSSNFHDLPTVWRHSYVTHLVSGLRLLAGRFDTMLLANDMHYRHLEDVSGSHPAIVPHLGSRSFQVIDDGGEAGRADKARVIAPWPEAMSHLRVCFKNSGSHLNCCRCQKCLRTILSFWTVGCPTPPAFARPATARDVRRVRFRNPRTAQYWKDLVAAAEHSGHGRPDWVKAARAVLRRTRRYWFLNRIRRPFIPLRNLIRRIFRGSPLSRKELTRQSAAADQHPMSLS